jgi:hypothetical protein
MSIRLTALLVPVLSACGFQPDPGSPPDAAPAMSVVEQAISCSHWKYICDPVDPWANWSCEQACEGSGHCMDYSPREVAWCAAHPDQFYNPLKLCGPSGDPLWRTWCVPGSVP